MIEFGSTDGLLVRDQFGNHHRITQEICRGGQGAVYRTTDPDIAVKLNFDEGTEAKRKIANVRCLPFPPDIPVALPLAVLKDRSGYVMGLLDGMESFRCLDLSGDQRASISRRETPLWLSAADERTRDLLVHYVESGSTKRRLGVLARAAGILARLHARGIVYGDVSPNNCFIDEKNDDVWLIDPDNLRLETSSNKGGTYTPRYGAPEVVSRLDSSRLRTDSWSFAVMAFEMLHLVHPFLGAAVDDKGDEAGWDKTTDPDQAPADLYERAFAGEFPFMDDANDRSNTGRYLLPRDAIATKSLVTMFQETLGAGRLQPWRRFVMDHWAIELARAHDESYVCTNCRMSFHTSVPLCPFCSQPRGKYVILRTDHWALALQQGDGPVALPHRLFNPFSLGSHAETVTQVRVDLERERVSTDDDAEPPHAQFDVTFVGDSE
jgi:hypothetical protein